MMPLELSLITHHLGVFLVTMVGCAIAGVFAILEFLYGTRQSAKDAGKTWLEEMRGELDFIFQVEDYYPGLIVSVMLSVSRQHSGAKHWKL